MNFDLVWRELQELAASAAATAPRLLVALLIVVVAVLIGKAARGAVHRAAARRHEPGTLPIALGRLVMAGAVLFGLLLGATLAFPNFTPRDFMGALGIGSIAAGFAFKDIFQNFLAGILILVTKPFRVNDQIVFRDHEGTVEQIHTRATYLRTYDGRRVVIPNGDLFVNSVIVNTAFPQRRMEYDIGIGYGDDIDEARAIILDVLEQAEGVDPDPKADVIVVEFAESSVRLRARWWSQSRIADVLIARNKVLTAVRTRLLEAGIDLPFPTRQILFHDQTETADGDRRRQREGWPAGPGEVPGPKAPIDQPGSPSR